MKRINEARSVTYLVPPKNNPPALCRRLAAQRRLGLGQRDRISMSDPRHLDCYDAAVSIVQKEESSAKSQTVENDQNE